MLFYCFVLKMLWTVSTTIFLFLYFVSVTCIVCETKTTCMFALCQVEVINRVYSYAVNHGVVKILGVYSPFIEQAVASHKRIFSHCQFMCDSTFFYFIADIESVLCVSYASSCCCFVYIHNTWRMLLNVLLGWWNLIDSSVILQCGLQ